MNQLTRCRKWRSVTLVHSPPLGTRWLQLGFLLQGLTGLTLRVWLWSGVLDVHVVDRWDVWGTDSSFLPFCTNVTFLKWSMFFACQMAWDTFTALLETHRLGILHTEELPRASIHKKKNIPHRQLPEVGARLIRTPYCLSETNVLITSIVVGLDGTKCYWVTS